MRAYPARIAVVALMLLTAAIPNLARAQAGAQPPLLDVDQIYGFASRALTNGIKTAREETIKAGVAPIPDAIRRNLATIFPAEMLDRVRYRVGRDGTIGMQAFQYGEVQAMTLIDIVVFRSDQDALGNDGLWAHELTHVRQYDRWGVDEFARRYVRDHKAVEDEAYSFEAEYKQRKVGGK